MSKPGVLFPAAIALFLAGLLMSGWFSYDYPWRVMFFPAMSGGVTVFLCLVIMIGERHTMRGCDSADAPAPARLFGDAVGLCQLVAVLPVILLFGYIPGAALFVVGFLRIHRESWRLAVAVGGGLYLFMKLVFVGLLGMNLPAGWLG